MLNYVDQEGKKTFIKSYTHSGAMLIIHYASGKDASIVYTREKEIEILKTMKEQVLNAKDFKKSKKIGFIIDTILAFIEAFCTVINVYAVTFSSLPIYNMLAALFTSLLTAHFVRKAMDTKDDLNDINKNMLFVEKEEELNKTIRENPDVLLYTKSTTQNMVRSVPKEEPPLTVNSIDQVPYSDIKELVRHIPKDGDSDDKHKSFVMKPKENKDKRK